MFSIKPEGKQFIVYSDNRNIGLKKNKIHRKLLKLIQKEEKDFILHVGDIVLWSLAWKSFFRDLKYADIKVPFFYTRGNHDNKLFFRKLFKLKRSYYSINYGFAHLIILDDNSGIIDKKQYEWLLDDLKNHNDYKWKIVFAHKPLYSGANHGVRKHLIEQLKPLLTEFNVKLFISSHYHNYERLHERGTTYIVSAGGGAPLTELKNNIPQLIKHETNYHFLVISIGLDNINIVVNDIDEKEIDRFEI
jgi:predicted phosphodiesterase